MAFEIDLKIRALEMQKNLDLVSESTKQALQDAIKMLSKNVYNEADRLAAQRLHLTRESYRNALRYEELGDNTYVVYIEPSSPANFVEEGYGAYDMKPGLLNGPNSKVFPKSGIRYNIVPLQHRPFSKETPTGPSKKMIGELREAIQGIIKDKSIDANIKKMNNGDEITTYKGIENPLLQGLTKVSKQYENKKGEMKQKGAKQSQYFVFRMVTSNTDASKWQHPGYSGLQIFKNELPRYVEQNIDRILKGILG